MSCDETQVIDLTAGGFDLTWPTYMYELTGKDISTDAARMLLTVTKPLGVSPAWTPLDSPHILTRGTITAEQFMGENPDYADKVKVPEGTDPADLILHWVAGQLFIGTTGLLPAPGAYFPAIQVIDTPTMPIRYGDQLVIA